MERRGSSNRSLPISAPNEYVKTSLVMSSFALISSLGFVWRYVEKCHFLYLLSTAHNTVCCATARTCDRRRKRNNDANEVRVSYAARDFMNKLLRMLRTYYFWVFLLMKFELPSQFLPCSELESPDWGCEGSLAQICFIIRYDANKSTTDSSTNTETWRWGFLTLLRCWAERQCFAKRFATKATSRF